MFLIVSVSLAFQVVVLITDHCLISSSGCGLLFSTSQMPSPRAFCRATWAQAAGHSSVARPVLAWLPFWSVQVLILGTSPWVFERLKLATQENAALRAELGSVKDRLGVVERIVTDQGFDVSRQIDRLREATPQLSDNAKN